MTDWKAFEVTVADHVAEVVLTGLGKGDTMGPTSGGSSRCRPPSSTVAIAAVFDKRAPEFRGEQADGTVHMLR
ncbi:hypothetical protein GCM10023147_39960 [Tsukamurella soli]|uniref:Uncharacterized protein n=1 Tax=Tsukamurella soli TaxID=644556 RepID=A0ABP8K5F5_9ACTN